MCQRPYLTTDVCLARLKRNFLKLAMLALTASVALTQISAASAESGRGKSGSASGLAIAAQTPAAEKAGGANAASQRKDDDGEGSHNTFLAGIIPADGKAGGLYLRLANVGPQAGQASVTIYDAATGVELAVWTSASIPSLSAIEVGTSEIAAKAKPALTDAQAGALTNFAIRSGFRGQAQLVAVAADAGIPVNVSACGERLADAKKVLGYVAGPGDKTLNGFVRIANLSASARKLALTLHNAADGATLGKWTSPDVSAHGSITVSTTTLASEASPVVGPDMAALVIVADQSSGLRLENIAQNRITNAVSDLTAACAMSGGFVHATDTDDDAVEDADDTDEIDDADDDADEIED